MPLLTARNDKKDLLLGVELGSDDYRTKPFDSNELRAVCFYIYPQVRPRAKRTFAAEIEALTTAEVCPHLGMPDRCAHSRVHEMLRLDCR